MKTKNSGFFDAVEAIKAGRAKAHALWLILSDEKERDGYALKPCPWDGPGEYQHVSFGSESLGILVRIPDGQYSLQTAARR